MTGKLNSESVISAQGMNMPLVGLGTWQATEAEVEAAIDSALEAGYRHIDTAYRYLNEAHIGNTLKKWFDSGKLKREDLFITTKLPPEAMNKNSVEEYLTKSLSSLQLSYVDLYLVHHPVGFKMEGLYSVTALDMETDHVAIWKAMEAQVDAGRARAIGLSNFNPRQIGRIMEIARIPPANLQVELYAYFQQRELQEYCSKVGITMTAYGPLGSPKLETYVSKMGGCITEVKSLNPLEDPVVVRIAQRHRKTPAQVLLRHIIQLGIAVIPKSSNPDRIQQNFQVFDFELSKEEMKELNLLDKGEEGRRFVGGIFKGIEAHPESPY